MDGIAGPRFDSEHLHLVQTHYKHMQALPLPELTKRDIKRFWSHVAKGNVDDCWEWSGKSGHYGRFKVNTPEGKRLVQANRISIFLATGVDDPSRDACHTCDNPPCCNPNHLWLGSRSENSQDAFDKGRMPIPVVRAKGEQNGFAKLTEKDVKAIRKVLEKSNCITQLSREYGVSVRAISLIRDGETWRHV